MMVKVSRDIIPYFDSAVNEIFETMLHQKVTKIGNYIDKKVLKDFGISAMIGFNGAINGNTAVSFTTAHSKKIVTRLLQEELGEKEEDLICDGVSEMINMISGKAKLLMAGQVDINIALPIIIIGNGHQICVRADIPQVFLMYKCEEDVFSVQLAFKIQ